MADYADEPDINPFQLPEDEDDPNSRSRTPPLDRGSDERRHNGADERAEEDSDEARTSTPRQGQRRSLAVDGREEEEEAPNCCLLDKYLRDTPPLSGPLIQITDAQKTTDVTKSSFIAYVIQTGAYSSRHRYSEFEALRTSLVSLHPTLIIPPIPSKHTLGDYAVKQSKAKEDATMIARRKRMLQMFLNRLAKHPTLKHEHVLHRFLEGRTSWAEIVSTPPLSALPKNSLKAPARRPTELPSTSAGAAYAALPTPSATSQLRQPNQRFLDSEAFTNRFSNHLGGTMERVNRRVVKRWSELSGDYSEMGARLNGYSLTENGALAEAIEKTGQAVDATYLTIGHLLQSWEAGFTEPLHEMTQFASIIQKLLKWRHMKHLQYEMAQDQLEAKRITLDELERSEAEAKRLDAALERGREGLAALGIGGTMSGSGVSGSTYAGSEEQAQNPDLLAPPGVREGDTASTGGEPSSSGVRSQDRSASSPGPSDSSTSVTDSSPSSTEAVSATGESAPNGAPISPSSSHHSATPTASSHEGFGRGPHTSSSSSSPAYYGRGGAGSVSPTRSGGGGGYGFLGALSHTFQGIMDVDPEATRRNNIGKTREGIAALEEALTLSTSDLRYAQTAIQQDLDRFQRQKVADIRDMVIEFAMFHKEFCRVNLQHWKEARAAIDRIEDDPSRPPPSVLAAGSSSPASPLAVSGAAGGTPGGHQPSATHTARRSLSGGEVA